MASEERHSKAAHNQLLFRSVNERIHDISEGEVPAAERVNFLCECADQECMEMMDLSIAEYESARLVPTHFPILPGHEWSDVERVVERNERYVVVEKFGEAGKIAVEEVREEEREQAAGQGLEP